MARRDTHHIFTISHTSVEIVTSSSKNTQEKAETCTLGYTFVFEEYKSHSTNIDRPL